MSVNTTNVSALVAQAGRSLQRSTDWCFTINNGLEWNHEAFAVLSEIEYMIYQYEQAPTTNTVHVQGFVVFKKRRTLRKAKQLLGAPTAHLEVRRGSRQEARDYCRKALTRMADTSPVEYGSWEQVRGLVRGSASGSGSGLATDSASKSDRQAMVALELIRAGKSLSQVFEASPGWTLRNLRAVHWLFSVYAPSQRQKPFVEWIYGATGVGKSRYARFVADSWFVGQTYWKPPSTRWFDGYVGQALVVMDDYRYDVRVSEDQQIGFAFLLRLFDRYPLQVEVKHGYVPCNPERIIVTTTRSPRETFVSLRTEDVEQMLRRLDRVVHMPEESPHIKEPLPPVPRWSMPDEVREALRQVQEQDDPDTDGLERAHMDNDDIGVSDLYCSE
ncbi:MAG: hypothetical protein QXT73_07695 [Candidatus Methanomethylicaceae archaeon]